MLPGDVVSTIYNDLNNKPKMGLFLVFYNSSDTPNPKNLLGFKITSKTTDLDQYSYKLTKQKNSFLDFESFVQVNKVNTLNISVSKKIGSINKNDLVNIFKLKNNLDSFNNNSIIQTILNKGGN